MVVAVTVDIPGGTEDDYEQMMERAFPEGTHPEGWLVHVSGPTESGWRVMHVAASQQQFEAFSRKLLLAAAGLAWQVGPPRLTCFPVHRLIWDRASDTRSRRRLTDGEAHLAQPERISRPPWSQMPRPVNASSTAASLGMSRSSR
jgi:hypothetical protein